jgi:fluoride ion exporter CrcB/FEX
MRPSITLSPRQLIAAIGVVAAGGAVGTALRDVSMKLHAVSPRSTDWVAQIPWALLIINALGAYVATWLLRGPLRHHDPNDRWRLVLVTGFFGGLTSYSGLFVGVAGVWHRCPGGGLAVALGAVASGVGASALGLLGHQLPHRV